MEARLVLAAAGGRRCSRRRIDKSARDAGLARSMRSTVGCVRRAIFSDLRTTNLELAVRCRILDNEHLDKIMA